MTDPMKMPVSHIDADLYGRKREAEEKLRKQLDEEIKEYNSLVFFTFSSEGGKELLEKFNEQLRKPIFCPGYTEREMLLQEGARQFIIKLLASYEDGKKQN